MFVKKKIVTNNQYRLLMDCTNVWQAYLNSASSAKVAARFLVGGFWLFFVDSIIIYKL